MVLSKKLEQPCARFLPRETSAPLFYSTGGGKGELAGCAAGCAQNLGDCKKS